MVERDRFLAALTKWNVFTLFLFLLCILSAPLKVSLVNSRAEVGLAGIATLFLNRLHWRPRLIILRIVP